MVLEGHLRSGVFLLVVNCKGDIDKNSLYIENICNQTFLVNINLLKFSIRFSLCYCLVLCFHFLASMQSDSSKIFCFSFEYLKILNQLSALHYFLLKM